MPMSLNNNNFIMFGVHFSLSLAHSTVCIGVGALRLTSCESDMRKEREIMSVRAVYENVIKHY